MRRRFAILAVLLGLAAASTVFSQEPARPETKQEAEATDPWLGWKWANFAILAVGLGYLASKSAPAFFRARTEEIQKDMQDSAKAKEKAEANAAAMDQRLAGLQREIETLRTSARSEIAADAERIGRATEQQLKRIQQQTAQEILVIQRVALDELRKYSAQLALDLAERRIGARLTPDAQNRLVDGFVQDLHHRTSPGARN